MRTVSDGPDLNPHNLINVALHHLDVLIALIPGCLIFGGLAWWLAPRRGWDRGPAALGGCALAAAWAVTLVRPFGVFAAGGLDPLATLRLCTVGSWSLSHLYEQLNVAMLVPFAFFGTLATRRPLALVASSALVSAVAEYVQAATGGGQCQARDLVHNTLGGVIGALLAVLVLLMQARRSRELTVGAGAGSGSSR
ncbi:MAG TPA: VanZ family protein [Pseudonocardiaceae bacterium]